ncbi:MAG: homoserine kinase [Chthoniobacteraceae bacterium]
MKSVTTRVPATTANLGPGFDCLGVALGIANRVTVQPAKGIEHPRIIADAAELFFKTAATKTFGFACSIEGEVPQSRGLGSSVTVRLGVLHGLDAMSGSKLGPERLCELCAELEGHPDNAAPAAFGGFTVARAGAETLRTEVDPTLKFILLIPDFEVSTPEARKVLPDTVPRRGAVTSVANACRITAAFLQRRYDLLRGCFADALHQPFREPLVPFLTRVIGAGERAGALGGFLSGSGSTICCLTLDSEDAITTAMLDAAPPGSRIVVASADNEGTRPAEPGDVIP